MVHTELPNCWISLTYSVQCSQSAVEILLASPLWPNGQSCMIKTMTCLRTFWERAWIHKFLLRWVPYTRSSTFPEFWSKNCWTGRGLRDNTSSPLILYRRNDHCSPFLSYYFREFQNSKLLLFQIQPMQCKQ